MSSVPPELNWVEKRAACTAERLFPQLVSAIRNDVAVRNAAGSGASFAAELTSDQRALIMGEIGTWARKERIRIFALNGKIEVRNEVTNESYAAEVLLNYEGRCMLKLADGSELEQWQFRRKALEGLFFGGQE